VKTRLFAVAAFALAGIFGGGALHAQKANPITAGSRMMYDPIKNYIIKAAAQMPEEHYSFKPSPDVRSFGQLVAHVADTNYGFCATVKGEKPPEGGFEGTIEKTKTTKAEIEKAVAASFAYCDKVHDAMTDAAGAAMVKSFSGDIAKLSLLDFNTSHDFEHYGNMVTYMRIKGLTPPSSAGSQ
jgi:uncharacterized damage-inducible protein DinB